MWIKKEQIQINRKWDGNYLHCWNSILNAINIYLNMEMYMNHGEKAIDLYAGQPPVLLSTLWDVTDINDPKSTRACWMPLIHFQKFKCLPFDLCLQFQTGRGERHNTESAQLLSQCACSWAETTETTDIPLCGVHSARDTMDLFRVMSSVPYMTNFGR